MSNINDNIKTKSEIYFTFRRRQLVKTLDKFAIGESGKVVKVDGERMIRRRLYDMGITNGAEIYLRKKAPLGDPIEVTVRSYELSLRKEEASLITMEVNNA